MLQYLNIIRFYQNRITSLFSSIIKNYFNIFLFRLTQIIVPVTFGIILTVGLIGNILVIAVVSDILDKINISSFENVI